MKYLLLITLVFCLFHQHMLAQPESFKLKVFQDAQEVLIDTNHNVELKKDTFDLVFEINKPADFLISASFSSLSFEQAKSGAVLDSINGFKGTGMAEGLGNEDLEIFLHNGSPNAWFYFNEKSNRFNRISIENKILTCTRTIQQLYDIESKEIIDLKNVEQPIYLVIVLYKYNHELGKRDEKERKLLKLTLR